MREIKFRIFDGKEMIYPEVIDFEREQSMDYYNWYDGYSGEDYKFDKYPLMQYTGLKDKNGKEIYEGDICRVLYTDWGSKAPDDHRTIDQYLIDISRVGTVEFFNYEWSLNFGLNKYGEDSYGPLLTGTHGRIELIGNIYENPDLINPT